MPANRHSLTPSELAWGAFYHQLHLSAMRLRALMEKSTSANGETREDDPKAEAEANQPIKAGERVNATPRPAIQQTSEVNR